MVSGPDLSGANLSKADLSEADLHEANLSEAYLHEADLSGADLRGANLSKTDLSGADLRGADLRGADLSKADLSGADLSGADLRGADLSGADLRGADLRGASLSKADLSGANLPHFTICPEEGAFFAWKYADGAILKVLVPDNAVRACSLIGRKIRVTHVVTLAAYGEQREVYKTRNGTEYRIGHETWADEWDDDPRVECTNGIHVFITRSEAEEFGGIS